MAAAYRCAADHAATETVEPAMIPAETGIHASALGNAMVQMLADRGEAVERKTPATGEQVPPAQSETFPAEKPLSETPISAPGAPVLGLDIAADIARQLIAAELAGVMPLRAPSPGPASVRHGPGTAGL